MSCEGERDLCNYEDVKALVGDMVASLINDDALRQLCMGDDNTLGLIARMSRLFETKVGLKFYSRTETIYLSGKGTNRVLLPAHLQPITTMTLSYQAVGSAWTETTNFTWTDGGVIRLTGQVVQAYESRFDLPRFAIGVNNVKAIVTYGYATVPDDVRVAVSLMVGSEALRQYTRLDNVGDGSGTSTSRTGLRSRRLGDREESYGTGSASGSRVSRPFDGPFGDDLAQWANDIDEIIASYLGGLQVHEAARS